MPQASADASTWAQITEQARGQSIYFYAWGGDPQVNNHLRWVARELKREHDIKLVHVKVADISEAVNLVLADKTAGRNSGGKVDLMWLNGSNFHAMKAANLLYGPFSEQLPNASQLDTSLPTDQDFSVAVEGLESPWGVGQLVLLFDESKGQAPQSAEALLAYARQHPGRISYPIPPQFHGVSFLKQLLLELTEYPAALSQPVDETNFAAVTAPLWDYLDQLHAVSWQRGRSFPVNDQHMQQLLDDSELHMALSFNPMAAEAAIAQGDLEPTVAASAFTAGALTNIHFVAIPYNSDAKAAAQVVADFLLSEEAQRRKADPQLWGDPPVIRGVSQKPLFPSQAEPHPSWQRALSDAWRQRYAQG